MPQLSPAVASPDFSHPLLAAPEFLRSWPSWAAWSAPTKRPLDLRRALAGGSVTSPDTWAPYESAMRHLRRVAPPLPYTHQVPLGVGILIAPPLIFIDFDDLLDSDGRAPEWALLVIDRAIKSGAYVERSASAQGAHILLRVSPDSPALRRNRYTRSHPTGTPVGIEIYARDRFCALTGLAFRTNQPDPQPTLNSPEEGDKLLAYFISELEVNAAPILTPDLPPAPLTVPPPTQPILDLLPALLTHGIRNAFSSPQETFDAWQKRRQLSNSDSSLSAWRFSLFLEASRQCPMSPSPVYELFNPQAVPAHPGIPQWQEFSGHSKKPHRRYADIQRAHAMVQEELRLLALDLGGTPPPPPEPEPAPVPDDTEAPDPSWVQLGLVMRVGKNGASKPVPTSINFIRIISRHPLFARHRIERNLLDGSTLCDRMPLQDTQITRWLEPLRAVLDMPQDPPAQGVRDAVEVIADEHPYDPLVEYLDSLPQWTPPPGYQPDTSLLSNWLEKVGAAPSQDIKKYARRILLGLVARALKPGVKFDYVPVFEGPQGVGKSSLVKTLVSPNFYATLFGGLHSKDALMTLRGRWGVEISELAAFKKTDTETLKSFFSTDTDVFRPPYARGMLTIQRRTVMFGTTNDAQYLNDHTGGRRYWPIYFPRAIDLEFLRAHRDDLFAEARYFFEKGEVFHDSLEESQSEERQRALQARLVTPAWQIKLLNHLQALPIPHLPDDTGMSHSGALTPAYVANLQTTLELPASVQHMNSAQLASFIQRAGYVAVRLSYRPSGTQSPTKLSIWVHPALARCTPDQQRAFLSNFPELFHGRVAPASWELLRPLHLESALHIIKTAPLLQPLEFAPHQDHAQETTGS